MLWTVLWRKFRFPNVSLQRILLLKSSGWINRPKLTLKVCDSIHLARCKWNAGADHRKLLHQQDSSHSTTEQNTTYPGHIWTLTQCYQVANLLRRILFCFPQSDHRYKMHVIYFEVSKGNSHVLLIFASHVPNIISVQKQLTNVYCIWWTMNERHQMTQDV